jgi:crotonobetainyl-CoA:carnitine CoA-transferase CaiB-like acyl-CoA transferase
VFSAADAPLVIAVGNEDIWRRFAPLVGLDPADSRFATNALRLEALAELHEILAVRLGSRTAADWLDRLRRAGVPAGEVNTLDRVYESEQARAENLVWEVDHPLLGRIRLPGNPVHYSRTPLSAGPPPPTLGQHTSELREAMLRRAG